MTDDHSDTSISRHDLHEVPKPLTDSEVTLLEKMVVRQQDTAQTGRFLTMHKRRRKKLTTRSLSTEQAPALLDDVHHGVVQVSVIIFTLVFHFLFFLYTVCRYIEICLGAIENE